MEREAVRDVILDCDPGVDDSLAILFALASKELKIKAVTTTFGNVDLEQATQNALNILELSGVTEPPVVGAGSSRPLKAPLLAARDVHGADGLGNMNLRPPKLKAATGDGVELIISKLNSGDADAIIATGPLTNLARAISREPSIARRINRLYIMGGAVFVEGNITPYAEFNFYCDPDAANYVLNSAVNITLVSLDVTHKINVTEEDIAPFKEHKNRLSEFVTGIIEHSIGFHREHRGAKGAHLHDPLAVAIALEPQLGEYEALSLSVNCADKRGKAELKEGLKNISFVRDVDVEGFLKLFLNRIGGQIEAL